jgi:SRSO17 transposase
MDVRALETLPDELERFASALDSCVKTAPSRLHLRRYLAGQIGDRPRKSVEPMALAAGVAPRTLQEFLASHRWDESAMEACLQARVAREHGHAQSIVIVDETSFPKKGERTPGVKRQHCGATGKLDNCLVTVHLGYVAGDFHALLAGEAYLPEEWAEDAQRRLEAGVPECVAFRTKWQIALEQLERAMEQGVRPAWLCADEYYGRVSAFRVEVASLGVSYVVEVPCNLAGHLAGRDLVEAPRRLDSLWERGGPSWQRWHVKDTTKGPAVWDVRAVRVRVMEERVAGEEQWLLIARNALALDEVKYFLSNAPADTPVGTLLYVAFCRWHVERLFEESKGEVGLDHYEGRRWQGLVRHLVLTAASVLFLAEQRQRLRAAGGSGAAFTLEQIQQAVEVQLDPEMPAEERRRQLARRLEIIRYYQRRNEAARRSHAKTRLRLLADAGIAIDQINRCPVAL